MRKIIYLLFLVICCNINLFSQTIRYVVPPPNGNLCEVDVDDHMARAYASDFCFDSWQYASYDLQLMIDISEPDDIIFVVGGTYIPSCPVGNNYYITSYDHEQILSRIQNHCYETVYNSFVLKSGVKIYGGFAGWENDLEERVLHQPMNLTTYPPQPTDHDGLVNPSILDGLLLNDQKVLHVVIAAGCDSETALNGFTIKNGNACKKRETQRIARCPDYIIYSDLGGGIYNIESSVTYANITVTGNNAYFDGGGIYERGSNSLFMNTIINNNTSGFGAGIYIVNDNNTPSTTYLINTLIHGNRAHYRGGAMYNIGSEPTIVNTTISGNQVMRYWMDYEEYGYWGYGYDDSENLDSNEQYKGGAIYNAVQLDDCIDLYSSIYIYNSIIWGNGTGDPIANIHFEEHWNIFNEDETCLEYDNCIIEGINQYYLGHDLTGQSYDADPFFLQPVHFDQAPNDQGYYRPQLMLESGTWMNSGNLYYYSTIASLYNPYIEGHVDLEGINRIKITNNGEYLIDMGAYSMNPIPLDLEIKPLPQICIGAPSFLIPFELHNGNFLYYDLQFSTKALNNGFVNKYNVPKTSNDFAISIPSGIEPGKYSVTITMRDQHFTLDEKIIQFSVLFPNTILEQKWNDVIAVLNNAASGYNYSVTDFRWYKNGERINGVTKSYYYSCDYEGWLDFNSVYQVEVLYNGEWIKTCPLQPKNKAGSPICVYD